MTIGIFCDSKEKKITFQPLVDTRNLYTSSTIKTDPKTDPDLKKEHNSLTLRRSSVQKSQLQLLKTKNR